MGRTCSFHKQQQQQQQQQRLIYFFIVVLVVVVGLGYCVAAAHQCTHGHHHDHDEEDVVGFNKKQQQQQSTLLPEEIAEEEDLKLMMMMMMTSAHHDHDQHDAAADDTGFRGGLWIHAMACSLLVSLASLICLILLPFIFVQGKPSRPLVDSLALFGAGAMLGDAFLHQLPHAFGGEHSHSHDDHAHHHEHFEQSHSHSLKDLSVGLSVLAGIVLFLIVEKLVRYVEAFSGGLNVWSLGHHHHHHHKHSSKLRDDDDTHENKGSSNNAENGRLLDKISEEKEPDMLSANTESQSGQSNKDVLRKRNTQSSASEGTDLFAEKISNVNSEPINEEESIKSQSNLVFGYLNLFSDGVHNFTDGMALGSAFLLYGSVGGWSRTLFLLAHELPQEIGDFGILVRSGFSVSKALFFNFLSALVALAGTALALMWGKDPGQSSLIEGFTAGGFIYIAVAGVLAEMNNGSAALRNTIIQLISLVLGMAVALVISLVE